jgi:RHS repeat-associated protein
VSYFYTKDHLGSIREMTDSSGTIQARYDYDPYGKVTKLAGSLDADFQYAGYYEHAASGLNLTLFRAYDPNVGKWLSRDRLGESQGSNLYTYVENNPAYLYDPLGLSVKFTFTDGSSQTANDATQFAQIASNAGAGTIDSILIDGHANSGQQDFNATSTADDAGYLSTVGNDVQLFAAKDSGGSLQDVRCLLNGKLAPNARIGLLGCNTADGPNNIVKDLSASLQTTVYGSAGFTLSSSNFPSLGSFFAYSGDTIYTNGNKN